LRGWVIIAEPRWNGLLGKLIFDKDFSNKYLFILINHLRDGIFNVRQKSMGSALYISAKRKPRGFDLLVDGKALAKAEEELSTVCSRLGVRRLMDFFGMSSKEIADLTGEEMPHSTPAKWFEPADGLASVRALLRHLEKDGEWANRGTHVIEDLRQCERVLLHLEEKKIPWHFALDI
jgi:hypothetical protein